MPDFRYAVHNIKLPSNEKALKIFQTIALIGGVISLCTAVIILLAFFSRIPLFADIFGRNIVNMPTVICFASSGTIVYFYNKKKLFQKWE